MTLKNDTNVSIGYALQNDPFQSGREAAQMAKSHFQHGIPQLVLAIGPSNLHFQAFIEGVRLVTGEDCLVGVPANRVFSNDIIEKNACVVVMINSASTQFSLATADTESGNRRAAVTSLLSHFRELRGNARHDYIHRGIIAIEANGKNTTETIGDVISQETDLESWLFCFSPTQSRKAPLMFMDEVYKNGVVGIECLSNHPFGIGTIDIAAFRNQPRVSRDAVRAALRAARQQMDGHEPCVGLLFFNSPLEDATIKTVSDLLNTGLLESPFLALSTEHPFVQTETRLNLDLKKSIICLLVPR